MSASRLRYLPLGGLGEVGINMWALEWEKQILVVDAGLMQQFDRVGHSFTADVGHAKAVG